jgi:AcrR family transcriptional regulator
VRWFNEARRIKIVSPCISNNYPNFVGQLTDRILKNEKNKSESARERIATAALALFAHAGYESASMRDISKAAGIVPGTLFHYFPAKADLLRYILRGGFGQIKESLKPYQEKTDPVKALGSHLDNSLKLVKANMDFWRMVHSLRMQNHVIGEMTPEIMEINGYILQALAQNFARLGHPDPQASAMFLFSAFDGIVGHYLMLGEAYPAKQMIDVLKKILVANK